MDIERIANDSGMQVVLDSRIGCEEYKSVYGPLQAFQRIANSVRELVASGNVRCPHRSVAGTTPVLMLQSLLDHLVPVYK